MSGLTEDDLRRIARFVSCPRDRRRPSMLCPDATDTDSRRGEGTSDA